MDETPQNETEASQRTEFKMVPDEDELAGISRDLRFHPSVNRSPRVLSADQIADFNRDGYLTPLRIFDREEAVAAREYFDDLLERTLAAGGDSYSITSAHLKHGRAHDLLTEPRITAFVADLLGEDVVGWGSHFFCKTPRDGKTVAWHQDASDWPLTPSKTVTVWLAIDDVDRENACVRFVPGSHREGLLEYRGSEASEGNVLNQTIENAERFGEPIDVELQAGEISIHSDLLLHGSEANDSDRRRCGLTLRYCPADVVAHLGWNEKGVLVSGSDASGHWANRSRPSAD
ncbi:MAG: phytanoyl-CoA dioxygenase family protein [Planctomycetales bacterium]